MKLLSILSVVLLIGLARAQEEVAPTTQPPPPPPAPVGVCLSGFAVNGVGNLTEEECDFERSSCQTKAEINQGNIIMTRQCQQTAACENNRGNNDRHCTSEDAFQKRVQICFYCCQGDLCNSEIELPDYIRNEEEVEEEGEEEEE